MILTYFPSNYYFSFLLTVEKLRMNFLHSHTGNYLNTFECILKRLKSFK